VRLTRGNFEAGMAGYGASRHVQTALLGVARQRRAGGVAIVARTPTADYSAISRRLTLSARFSSQIRLGKKERQLVKICRASRFLECPGRSRGVGAMRLNCTC